MLTNAENYERIRDIIVMFEMAGYKVTIDQTLHGHKMFVVHPECVNIHDEVAKYTSEILKNFPHVHDISDLEAVFKAITLVKANCQSVQAYKDTLEELIKEKVSTGYSTLWSFCNHTGLGEKDIEKAIACNISPEELYSQRTDENIEKVC